MNVGTLLEPVLKDVMMVTSLKMMVVLQIVLLNLDMSVPTVLGKPVFALFPSIQLYTLKLHLLVHMLKAVNHMLLFDELEAIPQ